MPGFTSLETCPRCGGGFDCGAAAGACDCFELRLSAALSERLAADWPGRCLCLACLRQLADADATDAHGA